VIQFENLDLYLVLGVLQADLLGHTDEDLTWEQLTSLDALESSRQRRQGELSQASIEVVHVEILINGREKTPSGSVKGQ
jgi:hypothetical protein